jgi:hypothetical protein
LEDLDVVVVVVVVEEEEDVDCWPGIVALDVAVAIVVPC